MSKYIKFIEPPLRIEQTSHNEIYIRSRSVVDTCNVKKINYKITINPKNNKQVTIRHDSNLIDSVDQLIEQLKKRQQKLLQSHNNNNKQTYKSIAWHLQNNIPEDRRHLSQFHKLYYNIQYKFQLVLKQYTFRDLKYVKLSLCYLKNCEFLQFMDMPVLETLILSSNLFTNFKPLSKAILPYLQYLNVDSNVAPQIKIQRFRKHQRMTSIIFGDSNFTTVLGEDLSFLAKLQVKQGQNMQKIMAMSKGRVKQYNLHRILQRKVYNYVESIILN